MNLTHLIPLSQFVDKIDEIVPRDLDQSFDDWKLKQLGSIKRYTEFLLQSLELKMFVPVSDSGEVLEEPKKPHTYASENSENYMNQYLIEKDNWLKAKEKCLFEGFEVKVDMHGQTRRTIIEKYKCRAYLKLEFYNGTVKEVYEHKTVERLIQFGLPLTAQAIKQILG